MKLVFPGRSRVAISGYPENSDSTAHARKSLKVLLILAKDLDECGVSREQVAFTMSGELGTSVTVAQIDAIVAQTKLNRLPAEWVGAWVKATGSRRLLDLLCEQCGLSVATPEEKQFAEFGRHQLTAQKLSQGLWEKI